MRQLDPKAVWLFFIQKVLAWFFFFLLFGWWAIPLWFFEEGIAPLQDFRVLTGISSLIIVVLVILSYVIARLSYHFYRYDVADLGFKKEHGIIWKRYVTIPYDRIQNVDIYRGVWARLLGLSDLHIQTAGFSAGGKGFSTEGRLPGLSVNDAEQLRDELIIRARQSKASQGL